MSQYLYAFDPYGTNAANVITESRTMPVTALKVIIPYFAPFFTKGIVVKQGTKVLKEGVDFYFGHRYVTGQHQTAQRMCGSIWIINGALTGPFAITYHTLGDQYSVTKARATQYLAETLAEPISETWEDVLGSEPYFPPVDIQFDSETFVWEPDLIAAIDRVAEAIGQKDPASNEFHTLATTLISHIENDINRSGWAGHLAARGAQHGETHHSAGALHVDGIAHNSIALSGLARDALTAQVLAAANLATEVSKKFHRTSDRTMTANMVLKDALAHIARNAAGKKTQVIDLSNGNASSVAENDLLVHADKESVRPGTILTLAAGKNELTIESTGASQDDRTLKVNGKEVITKETLASYATGSGSGAVPTIVVQDTDTMKFSGKGTAPDPLKVTVPFPDSTPATSGLAYIAQEGSNAAGPIAVSQKAVTDAKGLLATLVPTSRTLAGKPLTGDIELTKADFGLGDVEDLSDEDMPTTIAHYDALVDNSLKGHTHGEDEIIIQNATLTQVGIVQYTNEPGNSESLAIGSSFVNDLIRNSNGLLAEADTYLPDDVLSISRYGTYSYLPIPAQGNYPAAGIGGGTAVGEMEDDGTFVLLRSGGDAISAGVFYAYCKFTSDGKIAKFIPTTMEYAPAGLPVGAKARVVFRGSEGVFCFRDTLGNDYVVLTGGTMDHSKHRIVKLVGGPNVSSVDTHPIIADGRICFVTTAMEGSGRIYTRLWTIPLASIDESVEAITPQLIQLGGVDLYGNTLAPADVFYFTKVGQSANAEDQPLAHFITNKWSIRNVRHASNDFDIVAKGDKLRVMMVHHTYLANSYTSARAEWPMSYVIDLTTRGVKHDYDGPMPIIVDDGNIRPRRLASPDTCGLSGSGNSLGTAVRSKGVHMSLGSEGTQWVPVLRTNVSNRPELDTFDLYHMDNISMEATSGVSLIGNYGSALTNGLKCVRIVEGNRIVGRQSTGIAIAEYVNNDGFGVPGYGPTMNRKLLDGPTWDGIRKIPTVVKDGVAKSQGFVFADGHLSGNSVFSGDALSVPISVDPAEWAKLNAACKAWWDSLGVDPNYFIESRLMLYVTAEPDIPPIVVYYVGRWRDNDRVVKGKQAAVFEATVTKRTGNIGAVQLGSLIQQQVPVYNHLSLYTDFYDRVGTHYGKLDGGRWWMSLSSGPGMPSIGSASYSWSPLMVYNTTTKAWEYNNWTSPATHTTDGYVFTPEWGPGITSRDATAEAVYADVVGLTMADWVAYKPVRKVLSMTRVQEGWSVYFTEEVQGVLNGSQWLFPKKGFNLKTLFPGAYENSTFYIYADVTSGTADYRFSKTELQESFRLVKVGYCKTDAERIIELRVDAVTSITNFRELEDHINASNVHGLNTYTKETLGYGKVANMAPQYELANIGFSDVFNTWHRFSHGAANWTQPSLPSELNAWAYDAAVDTVKCTVNSASYIGFVSDKEVGDFTFDVEVGLPMTSVDGDNDAITLVIAFKTVDGKEHTLNVVRGGSIEGHLKTTTLFGVYYDYLLPDQKTVMAVDTGEAPHAWRGYYARMRVVRKGDEFTVLSTPAATRTWGTAMDADFIYRIDFTLNDLPELAKFKGLNRFGYGSLSQTDSTYRAYVRPDVDDGNHYATMGATIKELYWQQNIVTLTGTVRDGGVVPLPAGFTAKETLTFLYPHRRIEGTPTAYLPMTGLGISFDESTRVVTAKANYGGGSDPIEMAYYVLAMPSGNFLKK